MTISLPIQKLISLIKNDPIIMEPILMLDQNSTGFTINYFDDLNSTAGMRNTSLNWMIYQEDGIEVNSLQT